MSEIERLRAHVDRCPYGPLGEEWWCTHIPPHEGDDCYEADGNTVKTTAAAPEDAALPET